MIEFKDIKDSAKYAFENDEFYEFITGKNGWNMYEDILRINQNFEEDWGFSFLEKQGD